MIFDRLRRKATTGSAAEACAEVDFHQLKSETLTLEEKVTRCFEQWRDPIYRYLVAVFGDAAEAEEITQEAFLRLYIALHDGQVIGNIRAWAFRAAHNMAINRIRGQQFVALLDDEAWEELRTNVRDVTPNPEQRLLQLEKFNRLRLAIGRLTLAERECLHLRTKGLRYREIGEVLGLSTTTIADTLHRVIDKLTKENNG